MAIEEAINIKINADSGAKSLSELKKEFKETQKTLEGLTQGSREYIKTLEKLGGIKDQIGDLNTTIKAFNPEGKIEAVGTAIGGVASGFQAAQGAAALFGAEGEELQKTLLKVQAASALADGIKGVIAMGDAFEVLGAIIKANPITAFATALLAIASTAVAVYQNIVQVSNATDELTTEFEKQVKITEALSRETKRQVELLTAQGASEREIIAIKEKLTKQQIIELETSIKLHESKLRDIKDNDSIWEGTMRVLEVLQRKTGQDIQADNTLKAIQINKKERAKEDEEAIAKEKQDLLDLQNTIKVLSEEKINLGEKEAVDFAKKEQDKTTAYQTELAKRTEAFRQAQINAEKINAEADAYDLARKEKKKADEQAYLDSIVLAEENADAQKRQIDEKKAQDDATLLQAKKDMHQSEFESSKALIEATRAITDLVFAHQLNQAQGNAKKEREIKKRQFRVNKAFGIATSVIDGIGAVQKALNNPYPLNLILAIASGLLATANTVKIATTKFDDGGGGAGGGSSAMGSSLGGASGGVSLSPPQTGSTQLNPDGSVKNANLNNQPVKAFVTETDITKSQKRINTIEERAKL